MYNPSYPNKHIFTYLVFTLALFFPVASWYGPILLEMGKLFVRSYLYPEEIWVSPDCNWKGYFFLRDQIHYYCYVLGFGPLFGPLVLVSWECTQGSWAHNYLHLHWTQKLHHYQIVRTRLTDGLIGLTVLTVLTPGCLLGGITGLGGSISDPPAGLGLQLFISIRPDINSLCFWPWIGHFWSFFWPC